MYDPTVFNDDDTMTEVISEKFVKNTLKVVKKSLKLDA